MIYHSLNNATKADIFSKIHVSTDSSFIDKTVNSEGHEIDFMRPKSLSDDYATIFEVLIFVFETYEKQSQIFDEIWLLMACAPLIQPKNLVEASNIFDASKGPLVAVSELPIPIDWAYKKNEEGCLTLHNPSAHATRSQDLKKYYFDAGAFAVFSSAHMKSKKFDGNCIQPYELPKNQAVDIDTIEDWKLAEQLFKLKNAYEGF